MQIEKIMGQNYRILSLLNILIQETGSNFFLKLSINKIIQEGYFSLIFYFILFMYFWESDKFDMEIITF